MWKSFKLEFFEWNSKFSAHLFLAEFYKFFDKITTERRFREKWQFWKTVTWKPSRFLFWCVFGKRLPKMSSKSWFPWNAKNTKQAWPQLQLFQDLQNWTFNFEYPEKLSWLFLKASGLTSVRQNHSVSDAAVFAKTRMELQMPTKGYLAFDIIT